MLITDIEWPPTVVEKLAAKHGVCVEEVEEALAGDTYQLRGPEEFSYLYGRSDAGRYLFVVVRKLWRGRVRIVTARDMNQRERRTYQRR